MQMVIVSIKDRAAQAFGRPFYVPSIGVAIRSFQDEVNREAEDSAIYNHPTDFELYSLGDFDDATGKFNSTDPVLVMTGEQAKTSA